METITVEQAKKREFRHLSVALGTFDGLHIGHLALVNVVKSYGGQSAVFTFDALPIDMFQPEHVPMRLFTIQEKIAAFEKTEIDYLCIAHFDAAFAHIQRADFEQLLHDAFSPELVVAGYNYKYGNKAEGDADTLEKSGNQQGYQTRVVAPIIMGGQPVSSTRIRECIWAGDVENASIMLGYPYSMNGTVVHGRGIGRQLGYPTANIKTAPEKIVPKNGVYGVRVQIGYRVHAGVCNIGTNPTVSNEQRKSVEVHILSFDEDIYDQSITVQFIRRIRDEVHFKSKEQLIAQIQKDVQIVKKT